MTDSFQDLNDVLDHILKSPFVSVSDVEEASSKFKMAYLTLENKEAFTSFLHSFTLNGSLNDEYISERLNFLKLEMDRFFDKLPDLFSLFNVAGLKDPKEKDDSENLSRDLEDSFEFMKISNRKEEIFGPEIKEKDKTTVLKVLEKLSAIQEQKQRNKVELIGQWRMKRLERKMQNMQRQFEIFGKLGDWQSLKFSNFYKLKNIIAKPISAPNVQELNQSQQVQEQQTKINELLEQLKSKSIDLDSLQIQYQEKCQYIESLNQDIVQYQQKIQKQKEKLATMQSENNEILQKNYSELETNYQVTIQENEMKERLLKEQYQQLLELKNELQKAKVQTKNSPSIDNKLKDEGRSKKDDSKNKKFVSLILRNIFRKSLLSVFNILRQSQQSIQVKEFPQLLSPSLNEKNLKQVSQQLTVPSMRLKARLLLQTHSLLCQSDPRPSFLKWLILANPNLVHNSTQKILTTAKIRPQVAIWRMKKMIFKNEGKEKLSEGVKTVRRLKAFYTLFDIVEKRIRNNFSDMISIYHSNNLQRQIIRKIQVQQSLRVQSAYLMIKNSLSTRGKVISKLYSAQQSKQYKTIDILRDSFLNNKKSDRLKAIGAGLYLIEGLVFKRKVQSFNLLKIQKVSLANQIVEQIKRSTSSKLKDMLMGLQLNCIKQKQLDHQAQLKQTQIKNIKQKSIQTLIQQSDRRKQIIFNELQMKIKQINTNRMQKLENQKNYILFCEQQIEKKKLSALQIMKTHRISIAIKQRNTKQFLNLIAERQTIKAIQVIQKLQMHTQKSKSNIDNRCFLKQKVIQKLMFSVQFKSSQSFNQLQFNASDQTSQNKIKENNSKNVVLKLLKAQSFKLKQSISKLQQHQKELNSIKMKRMNTINSLNVSILLKNKALKTNILDKIRLNCNQLKMEQIHSNQKKINLVQNLNRSIFNKQNQIISKFIQNKLEKTFERRILILGQQRSLQKLNLSINSKQQYCINQLQMVFLLNKDQEILLNQRKRHIVQMLQNTTMKKAYVALSNIFQRSEIKRADLTIESIHNKYKDQYRNKKITGICLLLQNSCQLEMKNKIQSLINHKNQINNKLLKAQKAKEFICNKILNSQSSKFSDSFYNFFNTVNNMLNQDKLKKRQGQKLKSLFEQQDQNIQLNNQIESLFHFLKKRDLDPQLLNILEDISKMNESGVYNHIIDLINNGLFKNINELHSHLLEINQTGIYDPIIKILAQKLNLTQDVTIISSPAPKSNKIESPNSKHHQQNNVVEQKQIFSNNYVLDLDSNFSNLQISQQLENVKYAKGFNVINLLKIIQNDQSTFANTIKQQINQMDDQCAALKVYLSLNNKKQINVSDKKVIQFIKENQLPNTLSLFEYLNDQVDPSQKDDYLKRLNKLFPNPIETTNQKIQKYDIASQLQVDLTKLEEIDVVRILKYLKVHNEDQYRDFIFFILNKNIFEVFFENIKQIAELKEWDEMQLLVDDLSFNNLFQFYLKNRNSDKIALIRQVLNKCYLKKQFSKEMLKNYSSLKKGEAKKQILNLLNIFEYIQDQKPEQQTKIINLLSSSIIVKKRFDLNDTLLTALYLDNQSELYQLLNQQNINTNIELLDFLLSNDLDQQTILLIKSTDLYRDSIFYSLMKYIESNVDNQQLPSEYQDNNLRFQSYSKLLEIASKLIKNKSISNQKQKDLKEEINQSQIKMPFKESVILMLKDGKNSKYQNIIDKLEKDKIEQITDFVYCLDQFKNQTEQVKKIKDLIVKMIPINKFEKLFAFLLNKKDQIEKQIDKRKTLKLINDNIQLEKQENSEFLNNNGIQLSQVQIEQSTFKATGENVSQQQSLTNLQISNVQIEQLINEKNKENGNGNKLEVDATEININQDFISTPQKINQKYDFNMEIDKDNSEILRLIALTRSKGELNLLNDSEVIGKMNCPDDLYNFLKQNSDIDTIKRYLNLNDKGESARKQRYTIVQIQQEKLKLILTILRKFNNNQRQNEHKSNLKWIVLLQKREQKLNEEKNFILKQLQNQVSLINAKLNNQIEVKFKICHLIEKSAKAKVEDAIKSIKSFSNLKSNQQALQNIKLTKLFNLLSQRQLQKQKSIITTIQTQIRLRQKSICQFVTSTTRANQLIQRFSLRQLMSNSVSSKAQTVNQKLKLQCIFSQLENKSNVKLVDAIVKIKEFKNELNINIKNKNTKIKSFIKHLEAKYQIKQSNAFKQLCIFNQISKDQLSSQSKKVENILQFIQKNMIKKQQYYLSMLKQNRAEQLRQNALKDNLKVRIFEVLQKSMKLKSLTSINMLMSYKAHAKEKQDNQSMLIQKVLKKLDKSVNSKKALLLNNLKANNNNSQMIILNKNRKQLALKLMESMQNKFIKNIQTSTINNLRMHFRQQILKDQNCRSLIQILAQRINSSTQIVTKDAIISLQKNSMIKKIDEDKRKRLNSILVSLVNRKNIYENKIKIQSFKNKIILRNNRNTAIQKLMMQLCDAQNTKSTLCLNKAMNYLQNLNGKEQLKQQIQNSLIILLKNKLTQKAQMSLQVLKQSTDSLIDQNQKKHNSKRIIIKELLNRTNAKVLDAFINLERNNFIGKSARASEDQKVKLVLNRLMRHKMIGAVQSLKQNGFRAKLKDSKVENALTMIKYTSRIKQLNSLNKLKSYNEQQANNFNKGATILFNKLNQLTQTIKIKTINVLYSNYREQILKKMFAINKIKLFVNLKNKSAIDKLKSHQSMQRRNQISDSLNIMISALNKNHKICIADTFDKWSQKKVRANYQIRLNLIDKLFKNEKTNALQKIKNEYYLKKYQKILKGIMSLVGLFEDLQDIRKKDAFQEIVSQFSTVNPWFKRVINIMTIQTKPNEQIAFWKMRYSKNLKEEGLSAQKTIQVKRLDTVIKKHILNQLSYTFFKISMSGNYGR